MKKLCIEEICPQAFSMLTTFPKVFLHVPKYQLHMSLEMDVGPITCADSKPLMYDKLDLEKFVLRVL